MTGIDEEGRKIIHEQHRVLRGTIELVQKQARTVIRSTDSTVDLKVAIGQLQGAVLQHLADEERILEPFLRSDDSRNMVQASLLRAEHAHQRAVLTMLGNFLGKEAATALAARVLSLCKYLLADMEFEDRELLKRALDTVTHP